MAVSVVENSEEWRLKDLEFDLLTDLLVFVIDCFIPPKSNSTVKTISVSVHNDFSPLRTFIFSRRNLFIKKVNKYGNRLYTRLVVNFVIFRGITLCQFHKKPRTR